MRRLACVIGTALGLTLCSSAAAAGPPATSVSRVPFPTNVTTDGSGRIWVTSGAGGAQPSDGVWFVARTGARAVHVAGGLHTALGLAWRGSTLYVASVRTPRYGQVTALSGFTGRSFTRRRTILASLPIGRHTVDSIAPGPDGRLYLGVGSEFDAKRSRRSLAGTVVSFRPSGAGLRVEARGLRNPYGLAFVPGTSRLLVTDNGRDDLGPFRPPDELNLFDVRRPVPDLGFPSCTSTDLDAAACRGTVRPLTRLAAHASADGLAVSADGRYAYVAENGSSFPANPTGRDVVRVRISDGRRTRFVGPLGANDPLGAAMTPDGRLLVTLFASGRVVAYRP